MNINAASSTDFRYQNSVGFLSYSCRYFLAQLEGVRGGIPTNMFRKNVCDYQNLVNYKIDDDELIDEHTVLPLRKEKPLQLVSFIRLVSGVESHLITCYLPIQSRKRTLLKRRHRDYAVRRRKISKAVL